MVQVGRRMIGDPVPVEGLLVQAAGTAVVAWREYHVYRDQWSGFWLAIVDDFGVDDLTVVHVSLLA
jgi:hypothetical protein